MKKLGSNLFFALLGICFASSSFAQQQPSPDAASISGLQAFEGAQDGEYKLGDGDQITVSVTTRPELSGKHVIGPDGRISLPYAGSITVADKTRDEAAADIQAALKKYFVDPIVVVGVEVYGSNHVIVLGAVEHPGLMSFEEQPTLLSVVSRAGMLHQTGSAIQGRAASIPERVAIYRGNTSIMWVGLRRLLDEGKPIVQIRLQRNDVIYVPSANERYVSIFGEVLHPGLVQLESDSTLPEMLGEVGGIVAEKSGRFPKIQILHQSTGATEVISYEDILHAKLRKVQFESGDIIYVPQSKFERVGVTLQKISPLISIATAGSLFATR